MVRIVQQEDFYNANVMLSARILMKTYKLGLTFGVSTLVGSLLLNPLPSKADEDEIKALVTPINSMELGTIGISGNSEKFGEYNAQHNQGLLPNGNLLIRGGSAYTDNENGQTMRWVINGNDIGLSSRSLNASISDQGTWSFGLNYDELTHYVSNSYQTPYQGVVGGNTFTLPVAGSKTNSITAVSAELPYLQTMEISTTRKNSTINAGYVIDRNTNISFNYNHLDQSGAKLMAIPSAGNTVAGTAVNGLVTGRAIAILPIPTHYTTDSFDLALNLTGSQWNLSTSLYGSYFIDGYSALNFQTFDSAARTQQSIATPPDNVFNQFNVLGGYRITPKLKITGNFSFARNTQNQNFLNPGLITQGGLMNVAPPVNSLNGLINTIHGDIKIIEQYSKDLTLSAALKMNERNNLTTSNIYNFTAIQTNDLANYPNTPMSHRKDELLLTGDYRINSNKKINIEYIHTQINRWCNNYAVNSNYPAGTNCVMVKSNAEDKISANYRSKLTEKIDYKIVLGFANKTANLDPNALAAFKAAPTGTTLLPGQNGGNFLGFVPFFEASRKQTFLQSSMTWQARDDLTLTASSKYTYDQYTDTTYGMRSGNSWSANLDSVFNYRKDGSIFAYVTDQSRRVDMTNEQRASASVASATAVAVPAGGTWSNTLHDDSVSLGLGIKQEAMLGGKLMLSGDFSYTLGITNYNTVLNYLTTTTGGYPCNDPSILSCGTTPDIKSIIRLFKINSVYQYNKKTRFAFNFKHQRLTGNDYFYNGYQLGNTPASATSSTVVPSNQQMGLYNINVVSLSVIHNF